jgi:two-component system, OmpR family, sensor kinase
MTSLRRTLLVSLLVGIFAVFSLGGLASYRAARLEIDALMDYELRQFALSLRNQQFGRPVGPPEESLDFVIQVWDEHGVQLYLSHPHTVLPALAKVGYNTIPTSEGEWRTFSVPLRDRVIQVAQPMKVRRQLAADAALRTLLPMLAMLPLLGALIWYLVGWGLKPLQQLARDVAKRRADALDPLPGERIPDEVRPIVRALNHLLGRLDQALKAQRAFVADAAHELRTPLTALQIQLQLTERAPDEATRQAALADLSKGLARANRLVEQLLTLARQEPGAEAAAEIQPVNLSDVVRSTLADHAALANSRQIDLGARRLDDSVRIDGDQAGLRTLIGNLVDNAIRYTPDGGRVDVSFEATGDTADGRCCLTVDDSGPGIPPADRERVFDRFFRRPGTEQQGSGLGLAIVKRIADRHGAQLQIAESPLGGARFCVIFPCKSAAPGA